MSAICKATITVIAAEFLAANAGAASDPAGDFLDTYTGERAGRLDFTNAQARFDGSAFHLELTLADLIQPDPRAIYVWGIDRGAGVPRLNVLVDPDLDPSLKFDSLAALFTDGSMQVVTFPLAGAPIRTLFPGGAVFDGATVSASVDLGLLPSLGFAPASYQFQPWARLRANLAADGPNTEIADVGPRITAAVPEPTTWMMMLMGFAILGVMCRQRSARRTKMTNSSKTARLAGAAFALAALSATGIANAEKAEVAEVVSFADLDLSIDRDVERLDMRLRGAVKRVCGWPLLVPSIGAQRELGECSEDAWTRVEPQRSSAILRAREGTSGAGTEVAVRTDVSSIRIAAADRRR